MYIFQDKISLTHIKYSIILYVYTHTHIYIYIYKLIMSKIELYKIVIKSKDIKLLLYFKYSIK